MAATIILPAGMSIIKAASPPSRKRSFEVLAKTEIMAFVRRDIGQDRYAATGKKKKKKGIAKNIINHDLKPSGLLIIYDIHITCSSVVTTNPTTPNASATETSVITPASNK